MLAAIFETGNLVFRAADHNDGALSERRPAIAADAGDFRFQSRIEPMLPIPDAIKLCTVDVPVRVDPVGNPRFVISRPASDSDIHCHPPFLFPEYRYRPSIGTASNALPPQKCGGNGAPHVLLILG